jgi:DNA primase
MRRFWQAVMGVAAASGPDLTREELLTALETQGFDALLASLDKQIRFARLWTATEHAAIEDAREGYQQALALHMRARALVRQRQEIERELADAVEHGAEADAERLMLTLKEVQLEVARLENQEALVDGFGVMSGRVKGPAGGGH